MSEPLVTVLCCTYNHEPWIAEALEGFVAQEAPFGIEVLVHDDASTDSTPDIIRDYAARYPDLIRPILETENKMSRGINISRDIVTPLIRGKYVALCEGDDFWTDPHKLVKQVAALEAHPEADICCHCAEVWLGDYRTWYVPAVRNRVLRTEEVILGGGAYVATDSILCRRDVYMQDPEFRKIKRNDYALQILGSLRGGMVYLKDCMSVYRLCLPGSWTSSNLSREGRRAFHEVDKRMLESVDAETGGRYHKVIRKRMRLYDLENNPLHPLCLFFILRRGLIRMLYRVFCSK